MSSVLEVSRPTAEPVSLAEALQFLKQTQLPSTVPPTDPEASLIYNVFIPAARRYIEDMTGLTLASRNFEQYEDGFPFFPYFQSPYAPLFGAAFPFYFGYGPIASYPYPAIGGLQNQMLSPFQKRLLRSPVTAIRGIVFVGTDGKNAGLVQGKDFTVDFASTPGRIAPLPGQRWPVGIVGQNTVKILYTAGYSATETATEDILVGAVWQALTSAAQNSYILDPNSNVQLQLQANACTGKTEPTWPTALNATVTDGVQDEIVGGNVPAIWKNLGPIAGPYQTNHAYTAPVVVQDPNGNLQMLAVSSLTSQASTPTFATAFGAATNDNGQAAWQNLGPDESEFATDPSNQLTEYKGDIGIPEQLKAAVLLMLSHLYYNRDAVVAGAAVDVPHGVSSICAANRVWDFGPIQT